VWLIFILNIYYETIFIYFLFDLISIDNRKKVSLILIKVTNMLGQEIYDEDKITGLLLFYYSDGSIIKRFIK